MEQNNNNNNNGVHIGHCCFAHGCKYGHNDCPVELGKVNQYYPCEQCSDDYDSIEDHIQALQKQVEALQEVNLRVQKAREN